MMALVMLNLAHKERPTVHDWLTLLGFKMAGAAAGSGIAAWFKRSARWGIQVFSGCWFGVVGAHWLADFLKWPQTADYVLFSASLMGLVSYSLVELILSPQVRKVIAGRVTAWGRGKIDPSANQEP